jgi:methylthioribose-1-phosphate isomerase
MSDLPYLLRSENICRLEGGKILIGDRRVFPFTRRFEICSTVEEVALALKNMVTQGGGPLEVALTTLVHVARSKASSLTIDDLKDAARLLIESRPTNTTMKRVLGELLTLLAEEKRNLAEHVEVQVSQILHSFSELYEQLGRLGSTLIGERSVVLTTCFAEHTFLLSLLYAQRDGKQVSVLVPETRPYLQGSRLTAPSLSEMGIDVSIITDGMGASCISQGNVDLYMTAADLVCMDGTVVNKVGTLANALAAHAYHVPYHAFSISPDTTKKSASDVQMEMRPASEVTRCMDMPTTMEGIKALYPAFDIIPPALVTSIVCPKGILQPDQIQRSYT